MNRGRREMGHWRRRGFRRSEDRNVDEVEVEGVMIPCYDMMNWEIKIAQDTFVEADFSI